MQIFRKHLKTHLAAEHCSNWYGFVTVLFCKICKNFGGRYVSTGNVFSARLESLRCDCSTEEHQVDSCDAAATAAKILGLTLQEKEWVAPEYDKDTNLSIGNFFKVEFAK